MSKKTFEELRDMVIERWGANWTALAGLQGHQHTAEAKEEFKPNPGSYDLGAIATQSKEKALDDVASILSFDSHKRNVKEFTYLVATMPKNTIFDIIQKVFCVKIVEEPFMSKETVESAVSQTIIGASTNKCECGAEKAQTTHSDWCPKGIKNV